ncbi:ribosome small subunit-dependent GTPase A [Thermasporomyces composti]|uniref:Small ribosomal subunit biogenesis GTPase RsgA n=1 Tax=Thermasporomyces composti TaxID=696763 RepID=A0A3D9V294_THECX|nr:ribosome small subunit-dependent GTPase A [Thermasporomyces composti]REF35486.1 ribosome biogenesis GTPase [Thermasporomyces composti]
MSPGRRRFEVDDHEAYGRPKRRTRPRTKLRPRYEDAVRGVVVAVDRGRYTCRVATDGGDATTAPPADDDARSVVAVRARSLGRHAIVVGDRVRLTGDVSGRPGTLARIVEVDERTTVLRRTADDDDPVERVIVANADQLVIVTALAEPPPRPRLIDRCLVAAYDAGLDPLLCLTKADLAAPDELLEIYRPLGVPYVVTRYDDDLVTPLRDRLADRVSVLVGHSGVGKSTLVNALVPSAQRATGEVSETTGRGRHTSTQAVMLPLPFGGWIVDTPGIRSFGLAHVAPEDLIRAFPDLEGIIEDCPRGCTHARTEPECALDEAVAAGTVDPARLDSYRRLLDSRERRAGD